MMEREKLYNVGKYILDLPNVGKQEEIFDYIKDVEVWIEDFRYRFKDKSDFPSGWWICCVGISMDKKEFNEINDSLKELFWWDGLRTFIY